MKETGITINRMRCILTAAILLCVVSSPIAGQSLSTSKPAPAPARWRGLIGEYGPDDDILIIHEKDRRLVALFKRTQEFEVLDEIDLKTFKFPVPGSHAQ